VKDKSLNRIAIVDAAKCRQDEHGIYCVESPEFEMLLGAAETEGRAWEIFFELLDDLLNEYQLGHLAGYTTTPSRKQIAAKLLGSKGGQARTEAQQAARRANGAKGGRPRKTAV